MLEVCVLSCCSGSRYIYSTFSVYLPKVYTTIGTLLHKPVTSVMLGSDVLSKPSVQASCSPPALPLPLRDVFVSCSGVKKWSSSDRRVKGRLRARWTRNALRARKFSCKIAASQTASSAVFQVFEKARYRKPKEGLTAWGVRALRSGAKSVGRRCPHSTPHNLKDHGLGFYSTEHLHSDDMSPTILG